MVDLGPGREVVSEWVRWVPVLVEDDTSRNSSLKLVGDAGEADNKLTVKKWRESSKRRQPATVTHSVGGRQTNSGPRCR